MSAALPSLAAAAPVSGRFLAVCSALFLVLFVALGWSPINRSAWLLENLLVVLLFAALFATWRRHPLSHFSVGAIFVFLVFHEIGAHYTYSLVPYDALFERLFGRSLSSLFGFERNHFDRAIHFWYGVIFFFPAVEWLQRYTRAAWWVTVALPVDWILSSSTLYELIEWSAALIFGGDLGIHYLGTQGDVWDAHKDIAWAMVGSVVAAAGLVGWERWRGARLQLQEASDSARSSSSQIETSGGSSAPPEPV